MGKIFTFNRVISALVLLFFVVGGYVGYLSALVDIDEQIFFERVRAATDKERLEKQLARAKSILEARSRAYIRRSEEFIERKRAEAAILPDEEELEVELPIEEKVEFETVQEAEEIISTFTKELSVEDQRELLSLQEEKKDLGFFEDEVETIETLLARDIDINELELALASQRARRRISSGLRQLLLLLDKRKELAAARESAKKEYNFWQANPREAPDGVEIIVQNKGTVPFGLNPVHVTQLSRVLSIMPQGFDNRIRVLYIVYGDPKMRRGMAGVGVVFMKGEEQDIFRVMVHEFGHIWDLHREVNVGEKSVFYDGKYRLFNQDPSVTYYSYGWSNNHDRLAEKSGFASTYGMSDPFEDFAESYALYVMQGDTFRIWRNEDTVMSNKYNFIQDAFHRRSFTSTQTYSTRPYDVTMMLVDYEKLLE